MQALQTSSSRKARKAPPAAKTEPVEVPLDQVGERIVAAGLEHNTFLLDLNRTLSVPYDWNLPAPWNLPSRLFRFPIEVSQFVNGQARRIGLMHPALRDHPFVKHAAQVLEMHIPDGGTPNRFGYSKAQLGLWWHAVDLMTEKHWKDLLVTRQFTTDQDIIRAVEFALGVKQITVSTARKVMAELKQPAPADALTLLCKLHRPSEVNCEGSRSWPVNSGAGEVVERAWALILGLEAAWFKYDSSRHIGWTPLGRDRYEAGPEAVFMETASGQGAFAF